MLAKKFPKIDKFLGVLAVVLLVLALLVIFTFRVIFAAVSTAIEVDEEYLEARTPRIDKENLNKAYKGVTNLKETTLDLRE